MDDAAAAVLMATVVDATLAKLAYEDRDTGPLVVRRRAIWDLYHEQQAGSVVGIAAALRVAAVNSGVPRDKLPGAGLSHDSVRDIVEAPRP